MYARNARNAREVMTFAAAAQSRNNRDASRAFGALADGRAWWGSGGGREEGMGRRRER